MQRMAEMYESWRDRRRDLKKQIAETPTFGFRSVQNPSESAIAGQVEQMRKQLQDLETMMVEHGLELD